MDSRSRDKNSTLREGMIPVLQITSPLILSVIKDKKYRIATIKQADSWRQIVCPCVCTLKSKLIIPTPL